MSVPAGTVAGRSAGKLLTYGIEDSVLASIGEALKRHPAAEDIFMAAVWRICQEHCGAEISGTHPLRYVVELPPIREARSPGVLVRFYYEDDGNHQFIVDWVKFSDYNEKDAVSPPAYIIE